MSCVLVTGAAGFVGSHLIELLEQDSAQIVAWLRPGTEPLVAGSRVIWHGVELHDREAVAEAIDAFKPSQIYHLAGVPHIGESWANIHETFAGNVLGTHHLFDALRRSSLKPRVLITSTAFVYQPSDRAITEQNVIRPNSPYGTSKLAQEMLAERAWEDDGIPALIARAFNHVGPRQAPSFVTSSIARQIAEIEAGKKAPLLSMGNLDSQRDIMDVRDTVRAYHAMMASAMPGVPYNVCSGSAVLIRDLVELLRSKARVPITIEQDPSRFRPNDTPLVLGNHARLTADTGWAPEIPLAQTVEDLLAYWREQIF
ncbi:MAG TPA: GDP-mannose 4,6-dehydratase [Vicinamibacterales bacterium]|nr:GDP-mannose 4,6-dehydratase [Vicinamibacterales bacterium]